MNPPPKRRILFASSRSRRNSACPSARHPSRPAPAGPRAPPGRGPRPHTASGAVKGLQDAMALARLVGESGSLPEALAGYDAERPQAAAALVAVGRVFGTQQVLDTPDFHDMDQAGFDAWIAQGASAMHYAFRQQAPAPA